MSNLCSLSLLFSFLASGGSESAEQLKGGAAARHTMEMRNVFPLPSVVYLGLDGYIEVV